MSVDWSRRRVLVTGAEGFIGSTLVEHLLRLGAEVRAFVHYKPYAEAGNLAGHQRDIEVADGDIRDSGRVREVVAGCQTVFHLAALVGIPYSYRSPESYVQTNVTGTQNVVAACVAAGVERLVQMSTSETYGTAKTVPIAEDHPLQPQSPYAATKIGADMLALSFHHAFGLPVAVARPFNTYGPRQTARAVIPAILAQLHAGASAIRLGNLTPTRDFTFVEDTVRALLAIADCDRALGAVVNIGSGAEITIGDLAGKLIAIVGSGARIVVDPERGRPQTSEVERLRCDNSRIVQWTGWTPNTTLDDGLRQTSEWVRMHLSRFDPLRHVM